MEYKALPSEEPVDCWPMTALQEASETLGISCAGAKLLRIGQCATFTLPAARLVARLARPGCPSDALDAELRFARVAHRLERGIFHVKTC